MSRCWTTDTAANYPPVSPPNQRKGQDPFGSPAGKATAASCMERCWAEVHVTLRLAQVLVSGQSWMALLRTTHRQVRTERVLSPRTNLSPRTDLMLTRRGR